MTREAFIRKWLANKDFQYCEDGRAQMREDLDKVIDNAQQKLNTASVSGKRPTDDEITLVISEIANHFNSGLSKSLHQEYYITKVRKLFQAASASGAMDTVTCGVDDNGWHCQRGGSLGLDSECLRGCVLARNSCEG